MLVILKNSFYDNSFIQNSETTFSKLWHEVVSTHSEKLVRLKEFKFIHAHMKYPGWKHKSDIFRYIDREQLRQLIEGKNFFIFDGAAEGFSSVYEFPFFDMLYWNCKKYNVSPKRIIFLSANHRDGEVLRRYAKARGLEPIHVFTYPSFEFVVAHDDEMIKLELDEHYKFVYEECQKQHTTKLFLSLSRVNRDHRSLASFMLWNSNLRDYALMSQNTVSIEDVSSWRKSQNLHDYSDRQVLDWQSSLPLIVDQSNFEDNWALSTVPYSNIHAQTIFQIVNETIADDKNKTSLFYSEKTFRPIGQLQPFIIFGQPGCNHYLKKLGYKLYNDWFDLSFDFERDTTKRYKKLLAEVTRVTNLLNSMSKQQRIDWRFKNKEILFHNFNTMCSSASTKKQFLNFMVNLSKNT